MRAKSSDWYKKNWGLEIKDMSWVENTVSEVGRIIALCGLTGGERILDLACGYGRHSLELARRGFRVTGVDITPVYIEDARKNAAETGLDNAEFILSDIRDVCFENEFDVVLNLADGAIGYLENDAENLRIFDVISRALRKNGHHICDIVNGGYAAAHFPVKLWDAGEKAVSLSEFDFDPETRIMMFGNMDIAYGDVMTRPEIPEGDPTRVYTADEIRGIMAQRGMKVVGTYAGFEDRAVGINDFQMLVHSVRL